MSGSASQITEMSASEIVAGIQSREFSAAEAVRAHISRIEEVNPAINAVVEDLFDEAVAAAAKADDAIVAGEGVGPLCGLPMTIKDQFAVEGTASTLGLTSRTGQVATNDGPIVGRLREAGAIVLGKTNVPQLLMYHETDNPIYGRTNNPWDLERSPGGSSGGESALIAAGGAPLGLGGDLGGSIRLPAHFAGVAGLKPTAGRLTNLDTVAGVLGYQEGIIPQPGPLARTVADLELAMSVISTPASGEPSDATTPPVPWNGSAKIDIANIRVGIVTDDGYFPPAPAIRRAVTEAGAALESQGCEVVEWSGPDAAEGILLFMGLFAADGMAAIKKSLRGENVDKRLKPLLRATSMPNPMRKIASRIMSMTGQGYLSDLISVRSRVTAGEYLGLLEKRAAYRERFVSAMSEAGVDVLLMPPHALPAVPHGATENLFPAASYCVTANVTGVPAGVVPVTTVRQGEESDRPESKDVVARDARQAEIGSTGLPVGVQVVAPHWREDLVLAAMSAIEAVAASSSEYPKTPVKAIAKG